MKVNVFCIHCSSTAISRLPPAYHQRQLIPFILLMHYCVTASLNEKGEKKRNLLHKKQQMYFYCLFPVEDLSMTQLTVKKVFRRMASLKKLKSWPVSSAPVSMFLTFCPLSILHCLLKTCKVSVGIIDQLNGYKSGFFSV